MLNKFEIEGTALAVWITKTEALAVKIAVVHEHNIGSRKTTTESVFLVVFDDTDRIKTVDAMQGDKIYVRGHLYLKHKLTAGGNSHQQVMLMADEITVLKYAK